MAGLDLSHLHPVAREHAQSSDAERIKLIESDRWISYPMAADAINNIEWLLSRPRVSRMTSLLVHGASGMGKTLIMEKFTRDYSGGFEVDGNYMPIVSLQMPSSPDEKRFFTHLFKAVNAPLRPRETLVSLENKVLTLFEHLKPAAIFIDEFQHIGAASSKEVQRLLNLLKYLGNEFRMPIVAMGTDEALQVIKTDSQVASRFMTYPLPVWRETEAFLDLLNSIVATTPLHRPTDVSDRKLGRKVLKLSGGITGNIFRLMSVAAVMAIGNEERITPQLIDQAAEGPWRRAG